jgi:CSLREA domain-containing protein
MNLNRRNIKAALGVMMVCIAGLCGSPAHAATITVTEFDDGGTGNLCTLRGAIDSINGQADTSACVATGAAYGTNDTINLPAGTHTLSTAGTGEDNNLTGDLDIKNNMIITGAGASSTTIDANSIDRVIHVTGAYTVSISGVTITRGNEQGGGIYNGGGTVSVSNCIFNANTGINSGGGIHQNTGMLTISGSTFSSNNCNGVGCNAGAIRVVGGTASITNSTFSGNSAGGHGGAIFNQDTLTVSNSTFSGNSAQDSGGAFFITNGTLTITNTTISGNTASANAGGIYHQGVVSVTLSNTIVAGNTNGDCRNVGGITSNGYNLDSDNSCDLTAGTDIPNSAAANLDALANNGGSTQTMALLTGSAAINAGDDAACAAAANGLDQRGITRPQGAHCDIGAYEVETAQVGPNFVVTHDADTDSGVCGAVYCTLREAINAANAISGTDTITFAANYTITLAGSQLPVVTSTIVINGNGAANTVIQANAAPQTATYRVFEVGGAGNLTLDSLTVRNGQCAGACPSSASYGGGVYNAGILAVTDSTFSGNSANDTGGGLFNAGSSATVSNSVISGNTATNYGGGIYNGTSATVSITGSSISGNSVSLSGGGFLNNGAASIADSTIADNTAQDRGGAIFNGSFGNLLVTGSVVSGNTAATKGGGVANYGALNVTASTLDANTATTYGGGIYSKTGTTITDSTISGNTANSLGGGIYNDGGTVDAGNTILATNAAPDGPDCYGAITSSDYNLIQSAVGCTISGATTHDIYGQDPVLGPLQNNGGPTFTRALQAGSPAIDGGNCAAGTDQRGSARPQGAACDIGAYESNAQSAPTFIVNSAADTNDGSCDPFVAGISDCTLREAINAANAIGGADTITFAADYTITTASQLPRVDSAITLTGNGLANTIIQASDCNPVTLLDSSNAACTAADHRVLEVGVTGDLTLNDLTVQHGNCGLGGACFSFAGGGINVNTNGVLSVNNSLITGNKSNSFGGAIWSDGTLTVTNSTLSGSSAGFGGGIFSNAGTTTLTNSTISGNSASSDGGGILASGNSTVTVTNSTFSANSAIALGGGISNAGTLTLTNSTFSGNSASFAGGIRNDADGTLTLLNTIVANSVSSEDCGGTVSDGGNNIIEDNTCGFTGGVDPNLGALTGSPAYFPLNAASPAIDTGSNTGCPAASQNGITRPTDGDGDGTATCDIGAYEVDTIPDAFSFTAQTGVAISSPTTSNAITVAGIDNLAHISIAGGSYSINGGGYTLNAGTVSNGDTVTLQQTSSASFSTLTTATLTIGGVDGAFDVTTQAIDTTPDAFNFIAQTGVALSTVATSDPITVSGINSAANISIAGGTYSIKGGAYTSIAGTVSDGDTVIVRRTASGSYSTLTTATLTIGGVSGAFDVTTQAAITSYTGPTATGTGNATAIISGAGCGYTAAQFVPLAVSPPSGISFPHGLFDFTLNGCTPGGLVTLNITYPSAVPAGTQYWKYGPTPNKHAAHWYTIPAIIAGNTMTFAITDGDTGDDDTTANSVIVDAGGPGIQAAQAAPTAIPTLSEWGLILLAGMLGMFGMVGVRREKILRVME